jgi:hypothetical protein
VLSMKCKHRCFKFENALIHGVIYLISSLLGEIMKVGYTFACFMTKKTVFSQVIQLPTYKSIFFI